MSLTSEAHEISALFRELMNELKVLFQQEMQLFKLEMSHKASQAGKDVALIAMGGAIAYAGLLVILSAAVLGLAQVIPGWASALIVGVVVVGAGYALIQKGLSDLKTMKAKPEQTIESLKETKQWTMHAIN
jgi:hypothetical protein